MIWLFLFTAILTITFIYFSLINIFEYYDFEALVSLLIGGLVFGCISYFLYKSSTELESKIDAISVWVFYITIALVLIAGWNYIKESIADDERMEEQNKKAIEDKKYQNELQREKRIRDSANREIEAKQRKENERLRLIEEEKIKKRKLKEALESVKLKKEKEERIYNEKVQYIEFIQQKNHQLEDDIHLLKKSVLNLDIFDENFMDDKAKIMNFINQAIQQGKMEDAERRQNKTLRDSVFK